jgi:transposase
MPRQTKLYNAPAVKRRSSRKPLWLKSLLRCVTAAEATAEYLLECGADLNWVGHDGHSPLDAANRSGATQVVEWLGSRGARSARESTEAANQKSKHDSV